MLIGLIRPQALTLHAIRQCLFAPFTAISFSSSLFRYNYQQFE
ncbi:hypothetical protein SEHO0A_00447 [Salmonella enterica subsp. houtenae str. ATCC BAA-1581]|nr:hypothetical protein SEHO0A_00447 [Salmonella enterica subsp. houtenae str. ATCC BAA-1581]ENZ87997.1 hypothetical protein D088_680048 [Salmonella enterica subsp. houtenae serovar 16:z4,z32:-- str. RKS3027]